MVFNKAVVRKPFIKRAYICRKPAISHYKHKAEFSVSFAETAIETISSGSEEENPGGSSLYKQSLKIEVQIMRPSKCSELYV